MESIARHIITQESIGEYLAYLAIEEKAPATIEKYGRALKGLDKALAGHPVEKEALVAWRDGLLAQLSPQTVNVCVAAANGYLAYMGLDRLSIRRLKVQRPLFRDSSRDISREEYLRLVEAACATGDERLALVIQTLAALGLRISELSCVTVEAVRAGTATIACKGKMREVPLPGKLKHALSRFCSKARRTSGPVFVTSSGRPLDRSGIWRAMKRLAAAAGVTAAKVFPHNLRHLFAVSFWRASKDIARLASILGHASIETTRIYLMEPAEAVRKQVDELGLVMAAA